MSILDLRGPEFLQVFLTLFALLSAAGIAFRWWMSRPFDDHPSHEPELSPLEVAYLAGGAKSATDAAIASLVHRDVLTVRGSHPPRLKVAALLPEEDTVALEAAVYASVANANEQTVRQVRKDVAETALRLSRRLEQYEFLPDPMRKTASHAVPIVLMVGLLLFGLMKIAIGLDRGRPVGFLVVLCLLVVVATIFFAVKIPRRTRRGERFLDRLKRENAALHATATVAPGQLAYADLALAYALYGPVVLSMGPLSDLNHAMKRRNEGGGGCGGYSGSSCGGGGSSCGGGGGSSCGGGGGCGGCGGGGCGGS